METKEEILTFEELDKIINVLDEMSDVECNYVPVISELEAQHLDDHFVKYAPFLLFLQERMPEDTTEEEKAADVYISALFKRHVKG